MNREMFHNVVIGAALVGAVLVLRWGRGTAVPSGASGIATASVVAPAAWSNLPGYVKYNLPAWGPRMQPFIPMPNSSLATMDLGEGAGDASYGGFYSN